MRDITIKSLEACVLILPLNAFSALHAKDSKTLNFDDQSSGPQSGLTSEALMLIWVLGNRTIAEKGAGSTFLRKGLQVHC